jgi:hypothetical protein
MRRQMLMSVGVVLCLLSPQALPTPAEASSVNITIGSDLNRGRSISCRDGEWRLRDRGFRNIRRVDCGGRFFIYHASRDGRRYEIALSSHNGRVVDKRRIRR